MRNILQRLGLLIWRMVKPPSGRGVRRAVILYCLVLGLGRLGIFTIGTGTLFPARIYGGLLILVSGLLMLTTWRWRLSWGGRLAAALTAGVLAGLGADVLPSTTSALMLWVTAWCAIGETATTHECKH